MNETISNKKCFIVTPIGKDTDPIRRQIDGIIDACIIPALENKYEISVSHRKYETGSIGKSIIKELYKSDLVIANLTNLNANVMYELAIRYCTGKPAIIIAEKGTILPFDLSDHRTIFYENDALGTLALIDDLKKFISNLDVTSKGPVHDILGNIAIEENIMKNFKSENNDMAFQYIINRLESLENLIINDDKNSNKKIIFHNAQYGENTVVYNPLTFNFSIISFPTNLNLMLLKQDIMHEIKYENIFHHITSIHMIEINLVTKNAIRISFDIPCDIYSSEQNRTLINKIIIALKRNDIALPASANPNNSKEIQAN